MKKTNKKTPVYSVYSDYNDTSVISSISSMAMLRVRNHEKIICNRVWLTAKARAPPSTYEILFQP